MQKKFNNTNIFKLILIMGVPPMISMFTQSMYAIVDAIFVSNISQDAFTAVSLVYPMQNLVLSFAVGLGVGISSYISRCQGRKDYDSANKTASIGVVLTIIHYLIFLFLGIFAIDPFLRMFTSDENIFNLGRSYAQIVLFCSFGQLFHITFEKILQGNGNMLIPTIVQIIGCLLNILLDYIFIVELNMGVCGAAYATIIAQCTSAIIMIIYTLMHKRYGVNYKNICFDRHILKEIYTVMIPSTLVMALPSVLTTVLNSILISFSKAYVSIFGIYIKIQTFVFMPMVGLVQGLRPIIGYFYGSKNSIKIKLTMKYALYLMLGFMVTGTVLFTLMPEVLISLFDNDSLYIEIGSDALRIISLGYIFVSYSMLIMTFYESIGQGKNSLIITLARQFVITIILSYVFVYWFNLGPNGVWLSMVISEVCAFILAYIMFYNTKHNSEALNF